MRVRDSALGVFLCDHQSNQALERIVGIFEPKMHSMSLHALIVELSVFQV